MAIFGKKKKDKFVDLSGRLDKHQERMRESSARQRVKPDSSGTLDLSSSSNSYGTPESSDYSLNSSTSSEGSSESSGNSGGGFFGNFFGGNSGSSSSTSSNETALSESEERRKKLAKRIQGMTNKIEELENELFRMKQRIDILEKKQKLDY